MSYLSKMIEIKSDFLDNELTPSLVIDTLKKGFGEGEVVTPLRHHHDFSPDGTLLLMPSWKQEKYLGLKIITTCSENLGRGLPSIQGKYLLFSAVDGRLIAEVDAPTLTNIRTAAASALVASYLARENCEVLLMIGTGSLAPYLIKAHLTVRSFNKILIWGRREEKALELQENLDVDVDVEVVPDIDEACVRAHLISAATLSSEPLIKGACVEAGTHVDLVGSYKPNMREADDDLIRKASVYIDTMDALNETGDLVIPIQNRILDIGDITTLHQLCAHNASSRREEEITVFKSVGHASEDLMAATLAYDIYTARG